MSRLNQIIAVEKTVKADASRVVTDAYHLVQKAPLLAGLTRTYRPRDDEGEHLPGESVRVQVAVPDVVTDVKAALTRLFDLTSAKDTTNQRAFADIVVNDTTVAANVPVSTLLFLEKQLVDLSTFVKRLPTLDPAEKWTESADPGVWVAEDRKTTRSKKVPRNHVKAKATDKHPEQVEVFHEDVIVGDWTTRIFSGAIPATTQRQWVTRIAELSEAVKRAREEANLINVTETPIGAAVLGYVFA